MKSHLAALLLAAAPAAAAAQGMEGMKHQGPVATVKPQFESIKGYLIKSAEQMPEENYSFKPVATVRSFGEIIGHLADANYMFCAASKGEKSPATQQFEKVTGKAALVKGLQDAMAYCDSAYLQGDMATMGDTELFGMKMSRLGALIMNVTHDNEHYGNLVTYLRIKGLVPPSSQSAGM